jgi:hypothetical protein
MNSNQDGLIWLMSSRSTRLASAMAMSASDRPNLTESRLSANGSFRPKAAISLAANSDPLQPLPTIECQSSAITDALIGYGFPACVTHRRTLERDLPAIRAVAAIETGSGIREIARVSAASKSPGDFSISDLELSVFAGR